MLTEAISPSKNSMDPPVHVKVPAGNEAPHSGGGDVNTAGDIDPSEMSHIVADVQANLNMMHNVDLQFAVHSGSGDIMVTVTDGSTGEVIREIPPRELLNLAAKIDSMIGLIFDQEG